MSFGTRDRRGISGFKDGAMDVESLERENDRGIDLLSEKIGLLKQATHVIKNEADSHHSILDRLDNNMTGVRGALGSSVEKFKSVMSDRHNRKLFVLVLGTSLVLLIIWLLTRR